MSKLFIRNSMERRGTLVITLSLNLYGTQVEPCQKTG